MGSLTQNPLFVYPAIAAIVFCLSYIHANRVINFLYNKTLGRQEELYQLLNSLYIEADRQKLTMSLYLVSFGLGTVVLLLLWPNLILGLLIGTAVALLGWALPRAILQILWEKRCDKLVNQLVDGLTIMANGVKAGLSITQSMERVVENMNGPLAQEFNMILNKIRLGLSVEEALNEFGERIPRPDVQMLVTAVNILKETGGNLAETFETIVLTVRERQKIEKRIEAMTAQGIMQAIIITLVPFVLLIVMLLVNPTFVMPLFNTALGWVALFMMLGLQVIGGVAMKRIVTIKV